MQHREQMTRGVPSALQLLIDDIVHADSKTPGAAIHVEAPDLGLSWGGAAGYALPAEHPQRRKLVLLQGGIDGFSVAVAAASADRETAA